MFIKHCQNPFLDQKRILEEKKNYENTHTKEGLGKPGVSFVVCNGEACDLEEEELRDDDD